MKNMKEIDTGLGHHEGMEEEIEFDIDKPLPRVNIGSFAKKDMFLKEKIIQINGFAIVPSAFGDNRKRNQLAFICDGEDLKIEINQKNRNQLSDILGSIPKAWIGQSVKVRGYPNKWKLSENEEVEGIELVFSKLA